MKSRTKRYGWYKAANELTIEIRTDNLGMFVAELFGTLYSSDTCKGLTEKLEQAIKDAITLKWVTVIRVGNVDPRGLRHGNVSMHLDIHAERVWMAHIGGDLFTMYVIPNGVSVENPPNADMTYRTKVKGLDLDKLPHREVSYSTTTSWIKYDEPTWEAIKRVCNQIDIVCGNLVDAIETGTIVKMGVFVVEAKE